MSGGSFQYARAADIDDARFQASERQRIRQRVFQRLSSGILMNGDKSGNAHAFGIQFADAVAGSFGSNHADIHTRRRSERHFGGADRKIVPVHGRTWLTADLVAASRAP